MRSGEAFYPAPVLGYLREAWVAWYVIGWCCAMYDMKRRCTAQYRALCGPPAAVAAVHVPTCRAGALISRPDAHPSAVVATRRPLAGVSVIGRRWAAVACQARREVFPTAVSPKLREGGCSGATAVHSPRATAPQGQPGVASLGLDGLLRHSSSLEEGLTSTAKESCLRRSSLVRAWSCTTCARGKS